MTAENAQPTHPLAISGQVARILRDAGVDVDTTHRRDGIQDTVLSVANRLARMQPPFLDPVSLQKLGALGIPSIIERSDG